MPTTLGSWQEHLESHFSALRGERSLALGDQPIFALEHGLAETDISQLSAQIRAHASQAPPANRHWLVWAVYATELGYRYAGDEYWQTFEEKTPGWAEKGDRYWLRECFWKFCKAYGGAKPSGPWAKHFSIICWPITHAILPEDLQRQLAEILYQIRHSFRKELFESPELLGNEIAARSRMASPRFQNLAGEPLLLGQIAAALLIREKERARSAILPETLLRIAQNLDRERRSREWLKDAQSSASAKLTGVARAAAITPEIRKATAREELDALGIEPRVFLRPTPSSSWEVFLEIPDLAPLVSRFPALRSTLDSTCIVAGSSGRPLARGRLVHYGPQTVLLKRWPKSAEVLLQFEKRQPDLEYLLSAECLLRPGPHWLFKISTDGSASEIRGHVIRPGCKYVLLSTEGPTAQEYDTRSVPIDCAEVSATYIEVPPVVSQDGLNYFQSLGLNPARRVNVQPAGLPPVSWDGEGYAEWLSTDHPCICVSSDYPVKAVTLNLESAFRERLDIVPKEPGELIIVELPELPTGSHMLHVLVQSSADEILTGRLEVAIRDPRPWTKNLTDQNPLLVVVDPPNPSLEQFWEGKVAIQVLGPASRQVQCELVLRTDNLRQSAALRKKLPLVTLPLNPAAWHSYFETHVQGDEDIQNAYDAAIRCELYFTAEDLGQFGLTCEREFSPLGWIVKRESQSYALRLKDDTGDTSGVDVFRYEFEHPDVAIPIDSGFVRQPFRAPASGGLFSSRSVLCTRAVILPPMVIHSLSELGVTPRLRDRPRSAAGVAEIITLFELWAEARITGNLLSARRQRDVLRGLMKSIVQFTCGDEWQIREAEFESQPHDLAQLKSSISPYRLEAGFGAALALKHKELAGRSLSERVSAFAGFARHYLACRLPGFGHSRPESEDLYAWTPEFALRLATRPQALRRWAGKDFNSGIEYILKCPALARGARFLALAMSSQKGNTPFLLTSPLDWEWQ